jgi:site-specific DNA-methyltransferase (adenine-specific)
MTNLKAGSVDLVVTDPPYGRSWLSGKRTASPSFGPIIGDERVCGDWLGVMATTLADGGAAYITTTWSVYAEWARDIGAVLTMRDCIVWVKEGGGLGDLTGGYWGQHEFIIYATRGRHGLRGKRGGNVWHVDCDPPASYLHPTQKPVGLMSRAVLKSSDPGDLVLDPFAGSGTTLVAAQLLGRHAIGVEIEERYCEVAARRLRQTVLPLAWAAAD